VQHEVSNMGLRDTFVTVTLYNHSHPVHTQITRASVRWQELQTRTMYSTGHPGCIMANWCLNK